MGNLPPPLMMNLETHSSTGTKPKQTKPEWVQESFSVPNWDDTLAQTEAPSPGIAWASGFCNFLILWFAMMAAFQTGFMVGEFHAEILASYSPSYYAPVAAECPECPVCLSYAGSEL